jgi:hypothetical protein
MPGEVEWQTGALLMRISQGSSPWPGTMYLGV